MAHSINGCCRLRSTGGIPEVARKRIAQWRFQPGLDGARRIVGAYFQARTPVADAFYFYINCAVAAEFALHHVLQVGAAAAESGGSDGNSSRRAGIELGRAGRWRTNGYLTPFTAGALRMGLVRQETGEQ